jgi:hypothetical protein
LITNDQKISVSNLGVIYVESKKRFMQQSILFSVTDFSGSYSEVPTNPRLSESGMTAPELFLALQTTISLIPFL